VLFLWQRARGASRSRAAARGPCDLVDPQLHAPQLAQATESSSCCLLKMTQREPTCSDGYEVLRLSDSESSGEFKSWHARLMLLGTALIVLITGSRAAGCADGEPIDFKTETILDKDAPAAAFDREENARSLNLLGVSRPFSCHSTP